MQSAQNMDELFDKFLNRNCSRDEFQQLFKYFHTSDEATLRKLIEAELFRPDSETDILTEAQQAHLVAVHKNIKGKIFSTGKTKNIFKKVLPYAAAVLVFLFAGLYYWYHPTGNPKISLASQFGEDLAPGGNKATIRLSDGTVVELDENKTGVVASGNELHYTDGGNVVAATSETEYSTLSTPRSGQYRLILPDGTTVWLNAASSITYPSRFEDDRRVVKLQGEAYFDVTRDKTKPFIVESDIQQITVTGTQFNVNTYSDEPASATTLVEGQVKITDHKSGGTAVLTPGQQAVSDKNGLNIYTVDTDVYTGWKDGYFIFESTELSKILRQLSRWYNVDIDFSDVPEQTLSARVKRDKNISSVLNAIAKTTGLQFYINERKMILKK